MAYQRMFEIDGTIENVKELNTAYTDLTGDANPFFDTETEEWRAWVEYENGKTYILADMG